MKKYLIIFAVVFMYIIFCLADDIGKNTESPNAAAIDDVEEGRDKETASANVEWSMTDGNSNINVDDAEENADGITRIISDYIHMDSLKFQEKYKKDKLYENGILYCNKDTWKYDGSQLDAFQDTYYDVNNIAALRIHKKQAVPIYDDLNIGSQTDRYKESINIDYNTDYAVSVYGKPLDNGLFCIEEISFIKIELGRGTAPKELYDFIEKNYYEVMENLENETWILSPNGEKAACVSNGALSKHPAQIFIWCGADKPLTIFRRTWEHRIVGWIDNDHLICDVVDADTPVLLHLERDEIEPIVSEKNHYDTYGTKYEIQENYLIAECFGEQVYKWEIVKRDEEISVIDLK